MYSEIRCWNSLPSCYLATEGPSREASVCPFKEHTRERESEALVFPPHTEFSGI